MSHSNLSDAARRSEAERLIHLARTMLTDESEEIVVIYLEHAIEALRAILPDLGGEASLPA